MKPLSPTLRACAATAVLGGATVVACGGAAGGPVEPTTPMLIPVQPPPPPVLPSPAPSALKADAPRAAIPFKCDGGKRFQASSRTYCAYAELDSWEGSERRCVANGGHLMTLDTESTSEAVYKALGSPQAAKRAAWIGLELKNKKRPGPSEWKWSSGDAVKAESWNDGEPNNFEGAEACGEWLVVDGRWNDTRCDQTQAYVCQSKPGATLACKTGRAFTVGATTYCLNANERAFPDAKRACAADGGQLAELKTAAENGALREAMAARFAATTIWIGLTDATEEGNWGWVSGAPRGFEAWQGGEPNDFGDEDCAQLFADSWTWNDLDCNARLASVCEAAGQ